MGSSYLPQYYYVSTSNKHVNKKDGKQMIIDLTTVVFADRTRSKFTIDCCWPYCLILTSIPVNVVAKCKEHVNKWPLSYYSR